MGTNTKIKTCIKKKMTAVQEHDKKENRKKGLKL